MPNCLTLKKSNCKNCYKCIRHCPVKAIRFSGNQAHIIGNECILCGQCFVVCPQNAKEIVDETEKVKVLLQSGDPVIVSLAPSFIANYEGVGINAMRRALKKLGFYDVGYRSHKLRHPQMSVRCRIFPHSNPRRSML